MQNKRRTATFYIAIINVLIVVINVVLGGGNRFWIFLSGGGYAKGYGQATLTLVMEQGQWWRLLTCGYVHMGIIHLLGNMAALEIVGVKLEKRIGPLKYMLLYHVGTVLTAFLCCLIFPEGWMVGASLGIFVLIGMMCVLLFKEKRKISDVFSRYDKRYLVFYLIVGNLIGIGTVVAHLIGLVIGLLLGFVGIRCIREKEK